MSQVLAIALDLSPIEIGIIIFTGISFLVLFGISSAKGDYQGLIETTLANDKAQRSKRGK